ncbi:sugar-binding transcriptional regulator [Enterococcus sp. CWB-B31]|uniref:sugar-binding transcriptional regulator n=1 Tax=Enterococcus sp. CWB-B31 TaxID=2885159 RepID=UPI001E3D7CEE|nr:sugar-binding transcriptional regulator [Enterococcus sp. CWB-B31]MCB5954307.1 sugar-binding transcriptional regulator [Enterococcus sp. CWB-B31]
MKISEDRRKMMKIVTLYYDNGLTQAEIARKMKISRPVISKILQQAKEEGIVKVSIQDESAHTVKLSLALEERYQLDEVIIVSDNDHAPDIKIRQKVSEAAADYLSSILVSSMSIGLSWGTTLADMIDALPFYSFPSINVCPLVGGVSGEHLYFDTNHLAFRLSEKLNSQCQYAYIPALAESAELADVLNQSQLMHTILMSAKKVDLAIIGVGNPVKRSTWNDLGYFGKEEMETIKKDQVKGDAVASLFDKNGQTVNNTISSRMLGIKVEDLVNIPQVMVIGSGREKAESIHPLLMGNSCSILVTNQTAAEALLAM